MRSPPTKRAGSSAVIPFLPILFFMQPSKDFTGRPTPGSFCPEEVPSGKSQIAARRRRRQRRKATPNYATAARAFRRIKSKQRRATPTPRSPRSRGEPGRRGCTAGGGRGDTRTGSCCHSTAPPWPGPPGAAGRRGEASKRGPVPPAALTALRMRRVPARPSRGGRDGGGGWLQRGRPRTSGAGGGVVAVKGDRGTRGQTDRERDGQTDTGTPHTHTPHDRGGGRSQAPAGGEAGPRRGGKGAGRGWALRGCP